MTGKEIDRVDWPERNDRYGNLIRQNRNQMGVAYLDGKTPYILAARGTYKLMVVDAWMLKDGKLQRAWRWDGDEENPIVRSMGAHSMVTADVDGDGRDEILLGSCMLDDMVRYFGLPVWGIVTRLISVNFILIWKVCRCLW